MTFILSTKSRGASPSGSNKWLSGPTAQVKCSSARAQPPPRNASEFPLAPKLMVRSETGGTCDQPPPIFGISTISLPGFNST